MKKKSPWGTWIPAKILFSEDEDRKKPDVEGKENHSGDSEVIEVTTDDNDEPSPAVDNDVNKNEDPSSIQARNLKKKASSSVKKKRNIINKKGRKRENKPQINEMNQCPHCRKSMSNTANLNRHIRNVHGVAETGELKPETLNNSKGNSDKTTGHYNNEINLKNNSKKRKKDKSDLTSHKKKRLKKSSVESTINPPIKLKLKRSVHRSFTMYKETEDPRDNPEH